MKKYTFQTKTVKLLADMHTPVSVFLKIRDQFSQTFLLESSDYHGNENSYSIIGFSPLAEFSVNNGLIAEQYPNQQPILTQVDANVDVPERMNAFIENFEANTIPFNGFFGYTSFDGVAHFEQIKLNAPRNKKTEIPEIRYMFFKYLIIFNHFNNELTVSENLLPGEESHIKDIESVLRNRNVACYTFQAEGTENSNLTDEEYKSMVTKGKEHCYRGDVFQIVLSRQFSQRFAGDEFNVYRALRSINPSPYLFWFDFGSYRIFGSSPESHLTVKKGVASINPIAGTFKRTGDDDKDRELAKKLMDDPKENAEHVMLVDLARNDLSRNASDVNVEVYREVQYYSHVLHLVSKVSGKLDKENSVMRLFADTFPAGTLSGAPKIRAMQLIDEIENQARGFYGGCIGFIGLNGDFNQAIMIRTFLSFNNTLYYQAGAGIVAKSNEESELQEVNNKLAALKVAVEMATKLVD
jgi:anthranilate synthase component 1